MNIDDILSRYGNFKENTLSNRFFKHEDLVPIITRLATPFKKEVLGHSVQGRSITAIKWGKGETKVMLWSQMHGDEATGTMALFDLLNFLQEDNEIAQLLNKNCELLMIPMVNPDGAAAFTRRNAQQIDINRDYLQTLSPEAKLLKQCRAAFEPLFGFNLHDQTTLWSVDKTLKPATLSYLAPAYDEAVSINGTREKAMCVIADIYGTLERLLPLHIGLFDDEYEPRAFGDNFQKAGTSTILIEAGGYWNDPEKQQIRQFYFASILSGLVSIASGQYKNQNKDNYLAIPANNKQIFHYLIHNVPLGDIHTSVGINYDEYPDTDGMSTYKVYSIQDIGDLSYCDAYEVYHGKEVEIVGPIFIYQAANFVLKQDGKVVLAFENGRLVTA